MSLDLKALLGVSEEVSRPLQGAIWKNSSAAPQDTLLIALQTPQGLKRLLICLKDPFLRFHLCQLPIELHATPFTKQLDEYLHDAKLSRLQVLGNDRILEMHFESSQRLIVEFFGRRTNLYLLDENAHILLAYHPTSLKHYALPASQSPEAPDLSLMSAAIEMLYREKLVRYDLTQQKQNFFDYYRKQLKKTHQRLETLFVLQQESENWYALQHEGQLLQTNYNQLKRGLKTIEVADWELENQLRTLSLDPLLEPVKQIEARFLKARKLKKAQPHLKTQIAKQQLQLSVFQQLLLDVERLTSLDELISWQKSHPLPEKQSVPKPGEPIKKLPYRELFTAEGLSLLIGKGAKDNDALSFQYAHGNDLWFHIHNYSGAHVVLKVKPGQIPHEESIQDALQAALIFSQVKGLDAAEVCLTECKNLRRQGPKGSGRVALAKPTLRFVRRDENRWQALLTRKPIP